MNNDNNGESGYRFGSFELRAQPASLTRDGRDVELSAQPLRLLFALARRRGDIVSHDEIRELLWPAQNIDATGRIHACIRQIRRALDDDNGEPRFIETVPRQGYRFVADVAPLAASTNAATDGRRRPRIGLGVAAIAAAALAAGWWLTQDESPAGSRSAAAPADPFLRGQRLLAAGDFAGAADSLAEAADRNPEFAPVQAALSGAMLQLGQPDLARQYAARAIALDSTYARGYLQRARISGWVELDWAAAEADLERALDLTPDAAEVRLALAELHLVTGRKSESMAGTDAVLEAAPVSAGVLSAAGRLLHLQRRFDAARQACAQAAEREPSLRSAHECLYREARVRQAWDESRVHATRLANLHEADPATLSAIESGEALDGIFAFERWRLRSMESEGTSGRPVQAAYSNIALQQYDTALYLILEAADERSPALPPALVDRIFVGLFHQTAYEELARSMGVILD